MKIFIFEGKLPVVHAVSTSMFSTAEMNEENCEIPGHILKKVQEANENVLPGTSRSIYEKEYKIFLSWKMEDSVNLISEIVMMAISKNC
ncbi:hypothetical protein Zmor_005683 [Zophobas morio]|uniref:Uncharacterized protein n=1 Tax=Zophobas morio TaxID=2755281 RepID=A0AA38MK71_9CUCU|nr:hypothetical protein Zmor_010612 [Zophobas morio]KAJ3661281.1 hypothetical protein Zmor_005683 [Zophobas morio]